MKDEWRKLQIMKITDLSNNSNGNSSNKNKNKAVNTIQSKPKKNKCIVCYSEHYRLCKKKQSSYWVKHIKH